jgi:DNA-binding SARP family transcriptional activator/tetratricopeptide (TPR) repeat protein
MSVSLRLLGGAALEDDLGPVVGRAAQRHRIALLAILAISPGPACDRDRLLALLWPDRDERSARNLLYQAVHAVRQLLGAPAVISGPGGISLAPGAIECDAVRFHEAAKAGAPTRAVDLYSGPFMEGFHLPGSPTFEAWLQEERERLHRSFLEILQGLAEDADARNDRRAAARWWRRLSSLDPYSARFTLRLMDVLAAEGNRADAIRHAENHIHLMQAEFNAAPDPAILATAERLRTSRGFVDLIQGAPLAERPKPVPVRQRRGFRLVGRRREWQTLAETWKVAGREGPVLVLLSGEAGIGKTRLGEEFLHWVKRQGAVTARSRAYAAEGRLPFAPVVDWLRSPPLKDTLVDLDEPWVKELGRLAPELSGGREREPSGGTVPEAWWRQRFFAALARAVTGDGTPRAFLIDDLQWCDVETFQWLRYLLRYDPKAHLVVVGTSRSHDAGAGHPLQKLTLDLRRDGQASEIELGPLSEEETAELAEQVTGRPLDPTTVGRIHGESGGSPLFVVEMMRAQMPETRGDAPRSVPGPAAQGRGHEDGERQLPPRIQAVIRFRLAQLSAPARELAGAAAVLGRDFSLSLLEHTVPGMDEGVLLAALGELCDRGILRAQGGHRFDFGHDRLREVAYREMGVPGRVLLHRRAARALEELFAQDPDRVAGEIASHYELGGQGTHALPYYRRAARASLNVLAMEEAAGYLRRALDLVPALRRRRDRTELELDLQTQLSLTLRLSRGWAAPELGKALRRARALAEEFGDDEMRFQVLVGLQSYEFVRCASLERAMSVLDQMGRIVSSGSAAPWLVAYHFQAGTTHCQIGEFTKALAHLERALDLYDPKRHRAWSSFYGGEFGVLSHCFLAHVLWHLGRSEEATRRSEQALRLAHQAQDPFARTVARAYDTMLRQFLGDPDAVVEGSRKTMELAHEHGFEYYRGWAVILLGWALAVRGEVRGNIQRIRQGIEGVLATGAELRRPYYTGLLAEVEGRAGRIDQALSLVEQALSISKRTRERWRDADLHRLRGELLLKRQIGGARHDGGFRKARAAFRKAAKLARAQQAIPLEVKARDLLEALQ